MHLKISAKPFVVRISFIIFQLIACSWAVSIPPVIIKNWVRTVIKFFRKEKFVEIIFEILQDHE